MTAEIAAFSSSARLFLEECWAAYREEKGLLSHGVASGDMCLLSSAFLAAVLADTFEGTWKVCGGIPRLEDMQATRGNINGGMRDLTGRWRGHYWVMSGRLGLIVDVTADQFGHPSVLVTPSDDSRYRANYRAIALSRHVSDASWRAGVWNAAWKLKPSSEATSAEKCGASVCCSAPGKF